MKGGCLGGGTREKFDYKLVEIHERPPLPKVIWARNEAEATPTRLWDIQSWESLLDQNPSMDISESSKLRGAILTSCHHSTLTAAEYLSSSDLPPRTMTVSPSCGQSIIKTFVVLQAFRVTIPTEANYDHSLQRKEEARREFLNASNEDCQHDGRSSKSDACRTDASDDLLLKSIGELYGSWSPWSPCFESNNGSRIRIRERSCKVPFVCRNMIMREEDDCYVTWKDEKVNASNWLHSRVQYDNETHFYVVTDVSKKFIKRIGINLVQHTEKSLSGKRKKRIYSRWSRWTICTKSCMTQRYRWCKKVDARLGSMNNMPRQLAQEANTYAQGSDELYQTTLATPVVSNEIRVGDSDRIESGEDAPPCGLLYGNLNLSRGPSVEHMLRIIGGRPSPKGKWPWIVSILNRYKESICGGTLVSSQWVLTAAHCVKKRMYVTIGEHNLAIRDEKEIRLRVRKSVIHPDYDPATVNNDVALLKLPKVTSVDLESRVVCLPRPWQSLPAHQLCTILGWGKRGNGDSYGTDLLHEAQVPIVSTAACSRVYEPQIVTSNMFCAGYRKGRRDTCSGDSGGPLLCGDDLDRWTVFGITSFGEGCGKKGKFGIYTRLPNYVRWIQSVIGA
ncbi:hypothetical protein GE061_011962 [Apolygus lucorum]|uniref:Peptidase S1 domain-containing protein n=1 Tax=Apolygus lucorum TaxID=248454 RepID=A0A8S9XR01_APOLU|nr:hypothetical protein GE061_011962 [Apolygus lucorum]